MAVEAEQERKQDNSAAASLEVSSEALSRIQALYDRGLCRQAYDSGVVVGPLEKWRGADACILASRILLNLGSKPAAYQQTVRAFRSDPNQFRTQAYYLETFLAMRGPSLAWQKFREFAPVARDATQGDEGWEYLLTIGARICGHLRDFERADEWLKLVETRRTNSLWFFVEKAGLAAMREQWQEALALCRRGLEIRPWYRPAIQGAGHYLHILDRDDEALDLLTQANQRIESVPLMMQIVVLLMDLQRWAEAIGILEQIERLSPVPEKALKNWIAGQKCKAACVSGNYSQAENSAAELTDEYHKDLGGRLRKEKKAFKRVQFSVPFIQQYRVTCVPATLTMLSRFWKIAAEHVEVAEAICYDGTPSHRARLWAESNGMFAREFTLNWNTAVGLLDREIPFAVYSTEAMSAHVQVIIGYDELRRTFIIRNPAFPEVQEVWAEQFLKHYAASGPACMVLVPDGKANLLEGLNFPDANYYNRLRKIQQALENHERQGAGAEYSEMQTEAPEHWLTLTAGRAVYSYDTNSLALNDCVEKLLVQFPEDGNLLLARLGYLRETGRREERLEFLKRACANKNADAVFQQRLAEELMADARDFPKAQRALKRALRAQPLNAYTLTVMANSYWVRRRLEESLELHRFAACLEDKREPLAQTYFAAANAWRQTEAALAFLFRRWKEAIAKSPGPFVTWFNAVRQIGRTQEALNELENVLRDHAEHGDLWLTAADVFARQGDLPRAEKCLGAAEGRVQRGAFLRVKAELARYRTDAKTALSLWREALQTEPLSMPVHRSLVWVLAETDGREAALKHLEEVCRRFPHHYQLHQLWAEWARGAGPETAEGVTRKLVEAHPSDAWARRQLALVLVDAARFDEALQQAEEGLRLAPKDAVSFATCAHVKQNLDRTIDARNDFKQAIQLAVDFSAAIHGLVNSYGTVGERREALNFVEQELVKQVVFGDGLRAYREAARLNLEPAALLASLRFALKERPDLTVAWSVVIQQLSEMLELDEALARAEEATARFPLTEQLWHDLALVQRLRLDKKGEQRALEQAVMISPASSFSARMLGHFYERVGDGPRAKDMFEQACARSPLDVYSHGDLAVALWRQGKQAEAIDRIRHALKVFPGYAWGWQTLAGWAKATQQPTLAEELAKILVLQRPGELRSMLVLARTLAGSGRMHEALQTVRQSLKDFERSVEARELEAEMLEALGRQAEANAVCESEMWGPRPPAALRACRARLEAKRGNLVSAVERMESVLQENPGYIAGWQNLADWQWRRKRYEQATEAMTNVRRLDPLNPAPLGYRAAMKLQKNDRAGAKDDFTRALKYDPAYSYASLNLFDLQLEDSDIQGATHTLDLIKRYVGGEKLTACEMKFYTKFREVSAQPKTETPIKEAPARINNLDEVVERFKKLCLSQNATSEDLNVAIKALLEAGQSEPVDRVLDEAIKQPDCNPYVGDCWMRRRINRKQSSCTRQVHLLCPQSEAARRAVAVLIQHLGEQIMPTGRRTIGAYLIVKAGRAIGRLLRVATLLDLAWRHRQWLRKHNDAWASIGFALVTLEYFTTAIWWMRDWRNRQGLKMWMLYNLVIAFHRRWARGKALAVLEHAVKLPARDHTFGKLRLMLAMELALRGKTPDAAAHFHELPTNGWEGIMDFRYRCTGGMLAVQEAADAEKRKVFDEQQVDLRALARKQRGSAVWADYRRCLTRMAKNAKMGLFERLTLF